MLVSYDRRDGGASFIGVHIAVELRRRGFDVVVVDNLERAKAVDVLKAEGVPLVRREDGRVA